MNRLAMFDLDGTLIDSRKGIIHSLQLALESYGVTNVDDGDITSRIGSSLWNVFEHYLDTSDKHILDGAVAKYRHIYRDGPMFEYELYEGIGEALQALREQGARIVIATAKAHEYAREVVASGALGPMIDHVYGSELDGRNTEKRDLISFVLQKEVIAPKRAVMVGDRSYDIDGAGHNDVASVGVLYGYGAPDELRGATRLISSTAELPATLRDLVP